MEKFFNLSFLKYPISLIINMILVGFYLYIFPAKASTKVRENEFAAINLDIPSADKKIEEKNSFNQDKDGENGDFSAAEIERNERVELDNSRSDFILRTSKRSTNDYKSNRARSSPVLSKKTYQTSNKANISPYHRANQGSLNSTNSFQNKSPYQEMHGKTIEKLEERIKELEERKRLSLLKNATENTGVTIANNLQKNDGFSFKDQDLIPKRGNQSASLNFDVDGEFSSNRFYSNHRTKQNSMAFIPTATNGKSQQNALTLLKGRLLESKTVRNNTTVKIMLTERKVIGNVTYESGDVIGAKTNIQGDRLMLTVEGYIKNDLYIPLSAQAMDLDGLLGLKVSIDADNEMQKNAWGQNAGSTLGSVNPLLVYNPQGNLGQTVGNQVVGSLVNQSLNGANQYVNAKIRDVKVSIKTGQQLFLLIKN
jgi:Conjugative transposon, TraM